MNWNFKKGEISFEFTFDLTEVNSVSLQYDNEQNNKTTKYMFAK